MPQKTKENLARTCGRELPTLDPPAWAPIQLVATYEKHRNNSDLLPPNFNHERFFSTLRALICAPRMERVWSTLEQFQTPTSFPNLLFWKTFEALKGPSPEWVGLTPKYREKKLSEIEELSHKLSEITANTPLEDIDQETIQALGLEIPDIRRPRVDGSDLEIILLSVESKVAALRCEPPLLKKTKGEHPRRLLLFVRLNDLLGRYCVADMYDEIAAIATAVLIGDDPNDTIDADKVRKAVTKWKRSRAPPKSLGT